MSLAAATSFASTVFQYFSPTKSPFYPIVAFTTAALEILMFSDHNWWAFFLPLTLVLAVSTLLAFMNRPEFEEAEYNDQIKFARAMGVSSAVLCMAWISVAIMPAEGQINLHYWLLYSACFAQMLVLLLYTCVYFNKQMIPISVNFVQLALITATFIVGATYAGMEHNDAIRQGEGAAFLGLAVELIVLFSASSGLVLVVLMAGWVACMLLWCNHLRRVFRLTVNPADIRPPSGSNVIVMNRVLDQNGQGDHARSVS